MEECLIIDWLCEDVCLLKFRRDIFQMYVTFWIVCVPYFASEVMIFDRNMLGPRCELQGLCHGDCGKVILMYRQAKVCG